MDRDFVRHWVFMNFLGAGLGGAVAPLGTQALQHLTSGQPDNATQLPRLVVFLSLMIIGALEGAVIGALQTRSLRQRFTTLNVRRWITLTSSGFVWGWLLNAFTNTGVDSMPTSTAWLWVVVGTQGMLLGVCVGGIQAWLLRHDLSRPLHWVGLTTLGWTCALVAQSIAQDLIPPTLDGPLWIAATAVTGSVGGFILGALTGPWLDQATR